MHISLVRYGRFGIKNAKSKRYDSFVVKKSGGQVFQTIPFVLSVFFVAN